MPFLAMASRVRFAGAEAVMSLYSLDGILISADPERYRLPILFLVSLGLLLGGTLCAAIVHAPAQADETIAFFGP